MNSGKIHITGAAGFIGFHLSKSLLDDGYEILGYKPITTINKGIPQFIKWYKEYYSVLI